MTRLGDERGNVLATAMLLIAGMMMIGLATLAIADTQTGQSRKERERESTFNLTEAVLSSQTFVLGRNGTGTSLVPSPNSCGPASTSSLCPSAAEITRSFDGATQADFATGAGTTWSTAVRDNQDPSSTASDFYNPALTDSDCSSASAAANRIYCYDQNEDNQLWVRVSSTVRNKTRTVVALIKVEKKALNLPRYAILAGGFSTSNNGNKVIVDATGSLGVAVRCTQVPPASGNPCLGYSPSKGQLTPAGAYTVGYSSAAVVSDDDLLALEDSAKAAGTWYANCPASASGKVVYVKSGNCSWSSAGTANSLASPGMFIIENGTFNTGQDFYGVVYAVNKQNSSGDVVTTQGNGFITGGVLVEGNGKVLAGSSKNNVIFNASAFDAVQTTGTAGVVQNTWRELPAD